MTETVDDEANAGVTTTTVDDETNAGVVSATVDDEASADITTLSVDTDELSNDIPSYDETYTVSQLREAAKAEGIIGYSSMNKAALIEALNQK